MKLRGLLLFILIAVMVGSFSAFAQAQADDAENLVWNGGFEEISSDGSPRGWYTKAYNTSEGVSNLSVSTERAHSGCCSVCIENGALNDARYVYTASVEPQSMYCLSGYVYVEKMEKEGNGANLSLEDFYCVSECVFNSGNDWKKICWYGETGPNQKELTFSVRVGGYSSESLGKAYFDDISLVKVNRLPDDVVAALWYPDTQAVPAASVKEEKKTHPIGLTCIAILLIPAFFALSVFCARERTNIRLLLIAAFLLGFALRIWLAVKVPGYAVDIGCFEAWSSRIASVGPAAFYSKDYFCDYPPGMILLLWPIGMLLSNVERNTAASLLILKLLPILCDGIGAFVIYRFAKSRTTPAKALLLCLFYLLNPAVLVNGAAWGQVDSVLALLLTLAIFMALEDRLEIAIPLYVVSVLVKPQALLAGPVLLVWLIWYFGSSYKDRNLLNIKVKKVMIGIFAGLGMAALIVLPFSIRNEQPFGWLISLYKETLLSYDYITVNTANLYYLLGCNWVNTNASVPIWLFFVTAAAALAVLCVLLMQKQKIQCVLPMVVLFGAMGFAQLIMAFCHAGYSAYGYTWMAFLYLLIFIRLLAKEHTVDIFFAAAAVYIGFYAVGLKIHERYAFPALLLLLFSMMRSRDERVLIPFVGFSATTFLNTAIVLSNSVVFGSPMGHLLEDTLVINDAIAIINLGLFGYSLYLLISGLKPTVLWQKNMRETLSEKTGEDENAEAFRQSFMEKLHMGPKDYLIMGTVTLAYAVFTLATLGSTAAPQTAWIATDADEQIILSLPEEEEFSLLYYCGVSNNDFSFSVSSDGENWSENYPCEMNEGLCYRWLYAKHSITNGTEVTYLGDAPENIRWLTGKYIRINAENAGLALWEVVARNRSGKNIPLTVSDTYGGRPELVNRQKPAEHIADEMNTCEGEPGWYNGTYFDEIYYARTAYELLNGKRPYETTHPPLGKLLMAACVSIFGMTPFGWRFAGAFIGVLMLPVIYLLAMQLTHKRRAAIISLSALTLDLMHFAQTRLATIDSFAVFFIMLSYLFMIRYLQTDTMLYHDEENPRVLDSCFLKSMVPLLLCGISMGLSVASKWTGLYSACGLAVLFFAKQGFCLMKAQKANRQLRNGLVQSDEALQERIRFIANKTGSRVLLTCLCCLLFFIIIPCAIYYVSFIPRMLATGKANLQHLMEIQQSMLNYHSQPGLGMDHPFYSPWWQWPLILKPMWYAQDHYEPQGFASTIMCLGNPWVFYIGAAAMLSILVYAVFRIVKAGKSRMLSPQKKNDYWLPLVLAILFLVQYLPWVLVPRGTYIYHYFASVPFIIIATAFWIQKLSEKNSRAGLWIMIAYIVGAAVFFAAFLPYASGFLTPIEWLDSLKWFSKLYY